MHVRVQKWGNSLAVRIPKPLAEDAEVKEETVLNLAVSEGKVVATPVEKRKLTLKQLLSKVTRKNLHTEMDYRGSDRNPKQLSWRRWLGAEERFFKLALEFLRGKIDYGNMVVGH